MCTKSEVYIIIIIIPPAFFAYLFLLVDFEREGRQHMWEIACGTDISSGQTDSQRKARRRSWVDIGMG